MSQFHKDNTNRNALKNPSKITTRPLHGKVLLKHFKDYTSLAKLANDLRVEWKADHTGYPLKSTLDGIMEALIHNIVARDVCIVELLKQLNKEMRNSGYPITTKDEWEQFKLFEGDETYL